MAAVAASCKKALVNARWTMFFLAQTGLDNTPFGAPFLTFLGSFQSGGTLSGWKALTVER